MESPPLVVFSRQPFAPPLERLQAALQAAEQPASIGLKIAGDATQEELQSAMWDAVFLRWNEPNIHEVIYLEWLDASHDADAQEILANAQMFVRTLSESGGKLLIQEHLDHTLAIYALQPLPALLADPDHRAWDAINVILLSLAQATEGLIYADTEGFFDADGEPMILDVDLSYDWAGEWSEDEE